MIYRTDVISVLKVTSLRYRTQMLCTDKTQSEKLRQKRKVTRWCVGIHCFALIVYFYAEASQQLASKRKYVRELHLSFEMNDLKYATQTDKLNWPTANLFTFISLLTDSVLLHVYGFDCQLYKFRF